MQIAGRDRGHCRRFRAQTARPETHRDEAVLKGKFGLGRRKIPLRAYQNGHLRRHSGLRYGEDICHRAPFGLSFEAVADQLEAFPAG